MTPRMVEQAEKKGKPIERGVVIDAAAPLILGFVAYSVAAVSTFSIPQLTLVRLDPFAVALFTSIVGLLVIGLGYGSIIFLGGICSLSIAGLIGRLTKTKQVIRPKREKNLHLGKALIAKSHLVYLPLVLFFTSIALGWDIYSADPSRTASTTPGMLRLVLHSLNFFATPQHASGVLFSLRLDTGVDRDHYDLGPGPFDRPSIFQAIQDYRHQFRAISLNSSNRCVGIDHRSQHTGQSARNLLQRSLGRGTYFLPLCSHSPYRV